MNASDHGRAPTAPNSEKVLLHVLALLPLEAIAKAIAIDGAKVDDTKACRVRSGEARLTVREFCALLELADKKLVGRDKVCISQAELNFLRATYAKVQDQCAWLLEAGDE